MTGGYVTQLSLYFGERIVSKILLHPTLAGLVTTTFYVRLYIKDSAHRNNPRNLYELKTNITRTIADILHMTLQAVSAKMLRRARFCIQPAGVLPKFFATRYKSTV
jgi:hypothetical protein